MCICYKSKTEFQGGGPFHIYCKGGGGGKGLARGTFTLPLPTLNTPLHAFD